MVGTDRVAGRVRWVPWLVLPVGLLLSGVLVWHASFAAFTASTATGSRTVASDPYVDGDE